MPHFVRYRNRGCSRLGFRSSSLWGGAIAAGAGLLLGSTVSGQKPSREPVFPRSEWIVGAWADFHSQPPPPFSLALLHAITWWNSQGFAAPPAHLLRHLSTFIPLYIAYVSNFSDETAKPAMPFEVWLHVNGISNPIECERLMELYRLAERDE